MRVSTSVRVLTSRAAVVRLAVFEKWKSREIFVIGGLLLWLREALMKVDCRPATRSSDAGVCLI